MPWPTEIFKSPPGSKPNFEKPEPEKWEAVPTLEKIWSELKTLYWGVGKVFFRELFLEK